MRSLGFVKSENGSACIRVQYAILLRAAILPDGRYRGSAWKNATPAWPASRSNNGCGADKGRPGGEMLPVGQPVSQPAAGLTRRVAHNRILALVEPNNR